MTEQRDGRRRASVFEAAGGMPAFEALATAHHARCLADPVLEHPFSHGIDPDHVEHLARYWAEVLGGPPTYSSSLAGQRRLLQIHAGNDADDELGGRFVRCFVQAMDDADLPTDRELRATLLAYMRWAVADFMSYAPTGSTVPSDVVVPRWSWNGPEPP